jgi:hypothetical protein
MDLEKFKPKQRGILSPAGTNKREPLTEKVFIVVTKHEKAIIDQAAYAEDMKMSPFLRRFMKQHNLI